MQTLRFDSGACEYADHCPDAGEACKRGVFVEGMLCDPARRWMYCASYKTSLGMVFSKELGIWILPEWRNELMRRLRR